MRRPGFAVVLYHADTRTAEHISHGAVHNKSGINAKKPHGQVLSEISEMFGRMLCVAPDGILVRERSFVKFAQETIALNKVVGIVDMLLWTSRKQQFEELTPTQIKKYLTGNAHADKDEVADGLIPYIGKQEYACDDESDAAATAIAFLISEGYLDPILPETPEEPSE